MDVLANLDIMTDFHVCYDGSFMFQRFFQLNVTHVKQTWVFWPSAVDLPTAKASKYRGDSEKLVRLLFELETSEGDLGARAAMRNRNDLDNSDLSNGFQTEGKSNWFSEIAKLGNWVWCFYGTFFALVVQ